MLDFNKQQELFLQYIEQYKELVKEVGDSITDYQARCGDPYVITPKEHDFLTFKFYPLLQTLDKFLPIELARDIRQTIHNARPVLSSIFGDEDYEKYKDGSLAVQDVQKLMDAYTAASKILEPTKPAASRKSEETGGNATPAKIINIENFRGVLADDIQAEIVQTGDNSSVHEQTITGEKKKGVICKILKVIVKIIGAIVIGIIVAVVIDILGDFGWLQSIKALIYSGLSK
jgi:hypothetical protein